MYNRTRFHGILWFTWGICEYHYSLCSFQLMRRKVHRFQGADAPLRFQGGFHGFLGLKRIADYSFSLSWFILFITSRTNAPIILMDVTLEAVSVFLYQLNDVATFSLAVCSQLPWIVRVTNSQFNKWKKRLLKQWLFLPFPGIRKRTSSFFYRNMVFLSPAVFFVKVQQITCRLV
jgi:hypothetical protein